MSFPLESLYPSKISPSDFLRERTVSSMDCNEYKKKIYPQTPRIKQSQYQQQLFFRPQKTPEIPLINLTLPPIIEDITEYDFTTERICYFTPNQKQQPQIFDETSTDSDSFQMKEFGSLDSPLSGIPSKFQEKSKLLMKKCKSMKLEQLKRNRAASVALPRFSIYNFLKKIIRKQKRYGF